MISINILVELILIWGCCFIDWIFMLFSCSPWTSYAWRNLSLRFGFWAEVVLPCGYGWAKSVNLRWGKILYLCSFGTVCLLLVCVVVCLFVCLFVCLLAYLLIWIIFCSIKLCCALFVSFGWIMFMCCLNTRWCKLLR